MRTFSTSPCGAYVLLWLSACSSTSHASRCVVSASVLGAYLLWSISPNKTAPAKRPSPQQMSPPFCRWQSQHRKQMWRSNFSHQHGVLYQDTKQHFMSILWVFYMNMMVGIFISVGLDSAAILLTFRHLSEENQSVPIPLGIQCPSPSALSFYYWCLLSTQLWQAPFLSLPFLDWQVAFVTVGPCSSENRGLRPFNALLQ